MVEPRVLKGFRDSLPTEEKRRERMIDTIKKSFSVFGYAPIDTPCLEYEDILLSKSGGETEKQIYRFTDNGQRNIALRFDLTVPFARFVAQHLNKEITLPFKRYHIAKVWRGENSQKGRYREFYQCDVDSIGTVSASSDAEIIEAINFALVNLDIKDVEFHISHRGVLQSFLNSLSLNTDNTEILRTIDKVKKIGEEKTKELLLLLIKDNAKVDKILEFITKKLTLESILKDSNLLQISQMDNFLSICSSFSDDVKNKIIIDFSITRGLDYYTGFVFETFLKASEDLGSIASGGRYDNLLSNFSKEKLSGVGGSIGLDRLISALSVATNDSTSDVYVTDLDNSSITKLRDSFIRVDVNNENLNMKQIYRYIDFNKIPYMLTKKDDKYQLKEISSRSIIEFDNIKDVIKKIKINGR